MPTSWDKRLVVARAQPLRRFSPCLGFGDGGFDADNARAIVEMQFVNAVDAMQYIRIGAVGAENNGLHAVTIATMANAN